MIDPHKSKYHDLYWNIVESAARQSNSRRAQVGAVVVLPSGLLSIGWNGTPPGRDNNCEKDEPVWDHSQGCFHLKTKDEVIHAERNALDKLHRQGVPTQGALLFVSLAPCFECAKSLHGLGLKAIHYQDEYRDPQGVEFLRDMGVPVFKRPPVTVPDPQHPVYRDLFGAPVYSVQIQT